MPSSNNGLFMPGRDDSIREYRREDAYQARLEIQALVDRVNRGDISSSVSDSFDIPEMEIGKEN